VLAALFRAHGLSLVRMALLLTGDQATAEDVVQDAFLSFHRAMPGLRDQDKALSYLRTSVLNGCRSVHRARRRALLRRVEHDPPVRSAESAVIAEHDRREVLAAVARLPVRAREVLALPITWTCRMKKLPRPSASPRAPCRRLSPGAWPHSAVT